MRRGIGTYVGLHDVDNGAEKLLLAGGEVECHVGMGIGFVCGWMCSRFGL